MTDPNPGAIAWAALLVLLCAGPSPVHAESSFPEPDTLEISAFMESFHERLAAGDSVAVASLLADDVTIAEGGNVQSRTEYLSHHFHSDAAFLGSITREELSYNARVRGSTVVVVSTSRLSGSYRDREIEITSVETAVLEHSDDGWKIFSLHWSSGRR